MRVTVIPEDKIVVVDGDPREVVMPAFPNIHAIQWDGDLGRIEFRGRDPVWFNDFARVQPAVDAWTAAAPVAEPVLKVVTREALVDRLTNAELAEFMADMDTWTLRQREKFRSLTQVVEGTAAWTMLATKLAAKFGNARALELLAGV
jgi:hypothetical protein